MIASLYHVNGISLILLSTSFDANYVYCKSYEAFNFLL